MNPHSTLALAFATTLLTAPIRCLADDADTLLTLVKDFYKWGIEHTVILKQLEPSIAPVPDSDRLTLDATQAEVYAASFIESGLVAPDFARNVKRYYERVARDLKAKSDKEFAEMKLDGRGPLMETENMDTLFCAQEYEYKIKFIDAMTLVNVTVTGDRASAIARSPYQWETPFAFKKENKRWLIAGFCVFAN